MKLRSKQTGEIRKGEAREDGIYLYDEITEQWYRYELDLLASGWEYYEEPKDVYFIDSDGNVVKSELEDGKIITLKKQSIGNYFETKEEAEKAVEKLKAWKRLKDRGFSFKTYSPMHMAIFYSLPVDEVETEEDRKKVEDDFGLLFGGEE